MPADAAAGPRPGRRATRLIGGLLSVALFGWLVVVAVRRFDALATVGGLPTWRVVVAVVAVYAVANLLLADTWRVLMRLTGASIPRAEARWMWCVSQIARYTFGLAHVGGRTLVAARAGYPPSAGAFTALVELGFFLTTTSTLMLATAPAWAPGVQVPAAAVLLGAVPPLVVVGVLLRPSAVTGALERAAAWTALPARVRRRLAAAATGPPLSRGSLARVVGRYVTNTALRLGAFLLVLSSADVALRDGGVLATIVGAYAVGNFIGGVVVVAPGGVGVREGSTALLLTPVVGADVALVTVAVVRVLEVVAEIAVLAGARIAVARARAQGVPTAAEG